MGMRIEFKCSKCGKLVSVKDRYLALRTLILPDKCPYCGSELSKINEIAIDLGDKKIRKVFVLRDSRDSPFESSFEKGGNKIVSFKMPAPIVDMLDELSRRFNVPRSELIRAAIVWFTQLFVKDEVVRDERQH